MELLNKEEHLRCFNYDHSTPSQIEIVRYAKGKQVDLVLSTNQIVFFLEGEVKYQPLYGVEYEAIKGSMIFLPTGYRYSCFIKSDAMVMVFRLYNPVKLCESYFAEYLFNPQEPGFAINKSLKKIKMLDINPRIRYLIDGLIDCVADGIKCKHYFDMKIREFFMMLRAYYPKSELREFLSMILSRDTAFSEYVRKNRNRYPTVIALAKSMNMTKKQFSKRFSEVFECTPYKWMKEGRALTIHHEITGTRKPLKQISMENGFNSVAQFTKFCKNELGKTPMELRMAVIISVKD